MPTQKNSARWDLQLGFNSAFKRLSAAKLENKNVPLNFQSVYSSYVEFFEQTSIMLSCCELLGN
jgi:hypothetical protein